MNLFNNQADNQHNKNEYGSNDPQSSNLRGQSLKLSLQSCLLNLVLFRENKLEVFTRSTVFTDNSCHHKTLTTDNISTADHNRSWPFWIHFLLKAFLHYILVQFVAFSSDSTFVSDDIDSSIEETIGRNFHTIGQEDHITRDNLSSVDFLPFAISKNFIVVGILSHFIQLIELSFFLIVTDCWHQSADNDSNHDGDTIYPEHILLFSSEVLDNDWHDGCNDQNDQQLVTDCLLEYLAQCSSGSFLVLVEPVFLGIDGCLGWCETCLKVAAECYW